METKTDLVTTAVEKNDGREYADDATTRRSDRALLWRIDIRLMPIIMALYLLSFLDRINVSNAITLGLQQRLHLHGNQINIALALFYVPYILAEIPSNLLLKRLRPQFWLAGSMVAFGIVMICHGFVKNYSGLLAARFFLGLAEAGIVPGCSYLLSMWYRPEEAVRRFAIFLSSVTLAGAFGSLLASAIDLLDGKRGIAGWQWIFILEGVLTVFVGILAFFVIPDFPERAKWLSPAERMRTQERASRTAHATAANVSQKAEIKSYFCDYKSYLAGLLYLGSNIVGYSISYFLPTIIKGFHYGNIETQLHAVPPFAAAWGLSILLAMIAAAARHHLAFVLGSWSLTIAGAGILLNVHHHIPVMYAAVFLITAGLFGGLPIAVMWYVMNLEGHMHRALGTAWMIGFGNIGGIIATFSFRSSDAPYYHEGYTVIMFGIVLAASSAIAYGVGRAVEAKRKGQSVLAAL